MINVASTAKRRRLIWKKLRSQLDLFQLPTEMSIGNKKQLKKHIDYLVSKRQDPPDGRRNNKGNGVKKRKRK